MFACLRHKKDCCAGALLAAATAIKAFPILAVGYLVYRRHWKATAWTLAFLVVFLFLLPAPFRGFQRNLEELQRWSTRMAFNYHAGSFAQRTSRAYSFKNQSLIAVVNRLLRHTNAAYPEDVTPFFVNVTNLPFQAVNAVIAVIGLGLSLAYILAMPPHLQRSPESDSVEHAMLLLLILTFSPLVYQYFYVWLLYPLVVATDSLLNSPQRSRERKVVLLMITGCVLLIGLDLPVPGSVLAQAMGCNLLACLVLLAGFGRNLLRLRNAGGPVLCKNSSP